MGVKKLITVGPTTMEMITKTTMTIIRCVFLSCLCIRYFLSLAAFSYWYFFFIFSVYYFYLFFSYCSLVLCWLLPLLKNWLNSLLNCFSYSACCLSNYFLAL